MTNLLLVGLLLAICIAGSKLKTKRRVRTSDDEVLRLTRGVQARYDEHKPAA